MTFSTISDGVPKLNAKPIFNVGDNVQLRPETFKALEDMTVFDLFTIVRNAVKVAYGVDLQIGDKLADIAVPRK